MRHLNDISTSILDALPVGVVLLDTGDRVAFVNRALLEWFGSAAKTWTGQPWDTCWRSLDAATDGDELEMAGRRLRHLSAALPGQGRLEIFEDITALRDCEDDLREMFLVWDEASAFHAHELRNPLTAILGFGTLLRDRATATEEKRREWAARTVEKAQTMRESIELYSTSSRFLAERHRFHRSALSLTQLVEDVVRDATGDVVMVPSEPCWVNGDADRLRQLVQILLAYAQSHAPRSGAVQVRLTLEAGQAVLRVSDGAAPLPDEAQAVIFEPLQPRDGAPSSRVDLTIARGLASAHGGSLELVGQPDQGNTFRLSLPALSDQDIPTGS